MNRAEKAARQLDAVRVLRVLKRTRTYEELGEDLNLPPGDLNRYVNGHVLPGVERADEGYFDTTGAVFDCGLLGLVAEAVAGTYEYGHPDAVLTAATDGITLAAAFADRYDARAVYAKQSRETAVEEFYEARTRLESGIELSYYLPASALASGDSVLVVDDLVRTGDTQGLLLDIVDTAGGDVAGLFTLVAAGEVGLDRARQRGVNPVHALATMV
jgi:adenine phosphoribosyltransferase